MQLNLNYTPSKNPKDAFFRAIRKYNFLFGAAFFALLFGIGPLVADQLTGGNTVGHTSETSTVESSVSPSPIASDSISPSPQESAQAEVNLTPSPTPTPISTNDNLATPTSTSTASTSPTPTKIPPFAVGNQQMQIQIPRVLRIDPRAKQVMLPAVNFNAIGSPYLMLCIDSSRGFMDVESKGIDDSVSNKSVFIAGDRSPNVQIAGMSSQVLNIFNSLGGLKIYSGDGKGIADTLLYMRFVAVSEPTNNFALCEKFQTHWQLSLQPLGIQLDTRKNSLNLGNKSGK